MAREVPQKQMWVAPKLIAFGDVISLTKVNKFINAGDGIMFGIAIGPNPAFPGQPSSGFVSL
jgi:hypothetical protein